MPSKKKSTQQSTTSYGWQTPPSTPATTALQGMVDTGPDPSIGYNYAQRREDYNNSFQNPLGAQTSSAVRDAATRVGGQRMSQDENNAMQSSRFANNEAKFGRQATVAGLTAPQLTSTGSSGNATQSTPFNWGGLISSGASMGASAL